MQQYRDRAVRDTHMNVINVYRVLEDLNLDGMACKRSWIQYDKEMPGWHEKRNSAGDC